MILNIKAIEQVDCGEDDGLVEPVRKHEELLDRDRPLFLTDQRLLVRPIAKNEVFGLHYFLQILDALAPDMLLMHFLRKLGRH